MAASISQLGLQRCVAGTGTVVRWTALEAEMDLYPRC
jgi:hypothetical protein